MEVKTAAQTDKLVSYEGGNQVTEEEVVAVKNKYNAALKEWRVRRKACLEVVDGICEMMDQKRSVFFENAGLEDDKDVGLDINKYQ